MVFLRLPRMFDLSRCSRIRLTLAFSPKAANISLDMRLLFRGESMRPAFGSYVILSMFSLAPIIELLLSKLFFDMLRNGASSVTIYAF